ncbi:MAG TPA: hypothetical protein VF841_05875 [Anaeromyxobacter sp.]
MTVDQLFALYCAGHAEARRVSRGGVLRAFEVSVNATGLSVVERLVLEFALHDATNGTPARSRARFERAVRLAPELFGSLGLRGGDDRADAEGAEWLDAA